MEVTAPAAASLTASVAPIASTAFVTAREIKRARTSAGSHAVVSYSGNLLLPDPLPTDADAVYVCGVRISVRFGDVLTPDEGVDPARWVPVVPHFAGGRVYTSWLLQGGESVGSLALAPNVALAPTTTPSGVRRGILYRYDRARRDWDSDLEAAARGLLTGDVLALPPLGVNNGLSFFESAYRMLYSVLGCLGVGGSALCRLAGVSFRCPFDGERGLGARTVQHLLNLLRVWRATKDEPLCTVCCLFREDTLLPCGHRFCARCVMRIADAADRGLVTSADADDDTRPRCPRCRAAFASHAPCYRIVARPDFYCCEACGAKDGYAEGDYAPHTSSEAPPKEPWIFVPCGHHSSLCSKCHAAALSSSPSAPHPQQCRVCGELAVGYLRYFSSD